MQKRTFGPTGADIPIIGQGTWQIDGGSRAATIAALQRGIDLGMIHIDTAEMYGDAELIIADAITGRRDDVYLVSKVLPSNASRKGTIAACEKSLKRLKTGHLDCYLLHWPGSYPLEDTIAAFEQLVKDGKIASWGLSNFDVDELDEALSIAGENRIACNQVLYHLQERAIEHAVIPWCKKHNVVVVAYSPFGHGGFPSPGSASGRVLAEIASAHNATPYQIALAFLVREAPLFTIPKAQKESHVADNAAAGDIVLTPDEIARIDRAFPKGAASRGLPMI
ncbi:MAG: aldo/keto reductase [Parvibaculaceae bacterium]